MRMKSLLAQPLTRLFQCQQRLHPQSKKSHVPPHRQSGMKKCPWLPQPRHRPSLFPPSPRPRASAPAPDPLLSWKLVQLWVAPLTCRPSVLEVWARRWCSANLPPTVPAAAAAMSPRTNCPARSTAGFTARCTAFSDRPRISTRVRIQMLPLTMNYVQKMVHTAGNTLRQLRFHLLRWQSELYKGLRIKETCQRDIGRRSHRNNILVCLNQFTCTLEHSALPSDYRLCSANTMCQSEQGE